MSYNEAFSELQKIKNDLESQSIPVDELKVKVERSKQLETICANKIKEVEELVAEEVQPK